MIHNMYELISRKRDGVELSRQEIQFWIDGYVNGEIPDYQVSALLMAIYIRGMNQRETADLTDIMMKSGETISLNGIRGPKIDKHSTGGVGDKISFIASPLAAACGVKVPMISGRGLGHTGGTLDKLEAIPGFNVFLTPQQLRQILDEVGMVICGQTENLVPADRQLYALRDATATISSLPLIASSIMSKKLALGTDGLVLDVKTGSGAFMPGEDDAKRLCRTLVDIGGRAGRRTIGLITRMDQPLGRAVGNALEIVESIEALKGSGPPDLMEVAVAIAAAMLVAAGETADYAGAKEKVADALKTGRALDVFKRFIAAQGGDVRICDDYNRLPSAGNQIVLTAGENGTIKGIDALQVGLAAVEAGAGRRKKEDAVDHAAGFVFQRKIGDAVKEGEAILTIHTDRPDRIDAVRQRLNRAISIGSGPVSRPPNILHRIDRDGIHRWD
jgi:pyrimidine-nucleoside phosphorylase